eukprot:scaffold130087_cov24-Prasinocladus_malaysianus.AAC.2
MTLSTTLLWEHMLNASYRAIASGVLLSTAHHARIMHSECRWGRLVATYYTLQSALPCLLDVARVAAAIPMDPRRRVVPATGVLASSTFEYVQVPALFYALLMRRKDRLSYSGEVR